jgi:subtilisin family serine protease
VRVAILGAGIALDHPDLSSNVAGSPLLRTDSTGDGTLAAGVIGAVGDNGLGIAGIAWRVTLDPIGILTPAGHGKVSTVMMALRQAVKRGVSIGLLAFQTAHYSRALRETLKWTIDRGLLLVVPSGDRFGSDNDTSPVYPASYALSGLVSVAGLDAYGEGLSDTTNFGRGGVEIAAPSEEVLTTDRDGGYARASGSLLAASHVAGAAALLLSRESGLAPSQAHERLLRSAKPMKSLAGKVRSGATLDLTRLLEPSEN